MRIGINLLFLRAIPHGMQTYAASTLRILAARDTTDEYVVFLNRRGASLSLPDVPNLTRVVCNLDGNWREMRYAWEQLILPVQARRYGLDVLHSPGYQGPLRTPCPAVITLADVNFRDIPIPFRSRVAMNIFCPPAARRAARVITLSEFSKRQIMKHLGIPSDKIVVIHLGPGSFPPQENWDIVRSQYGLPPDYVVSFGGYSNPHKNIRRLIEAFALVRTSEPVYLAIIGSISSELHRLIATLNVKVLPLGFVEDSHMQTIVSHARLCVIPSLYEGFGLPVLEAQQAGTAVACSNAASLPEVAGGSTRLFNPESVEDITAAIEECLNDRPYCDALVRAGRDNLRRFSWEKTADATLAVYREVAGVRVAAQAGAKS